MIDTKQENIPPSKPLSADVAAQGIAEEATVIEARRRRQLVMELHPGIRGTRLSHRRQEALVMASTSGELLSDPVKLYATLRQPIEPTRESDWD